MIHLGKQWPLNVSFFADKCKCLGIAKLDATEPLLNMGHHLTSREFEIIKMISDGLCSDQIADKLFVSKYNTPNLSY